MNTLKNAWNRLLETKIGFRIGWTLILLLVLAALVLSAQPVQAAGRVCPAPGTGLTGAENMTLDPTMWTIPMVRLAQQGYDGMFHAVYQSACP